MRRLAEATVKHKRFVLIIFLIAAVASSIMATQVRINYNLADYVPDKAASTQALEVLSAEFNNTLPNASVYVPNITVPEALQVKQKLAKLKQVSSVLWLDDAIDLKIPLSMAPAKTVNSYYRDGAALFQVTTTGNNNPQAVAEIKAIIGDKGAISGQLIDLTQAQEAVRVEMTRILAFAIPLVLLILLLSTHSWIEPLLFMVAIFMGVLLNMGTNLAFGQVSFITQSVGGVLQLAVSMDYAVFMLHRFKEYRGEGESVQDAITHAMTTSFSAITSSAATTIFGFLALVFMHFKIGPDLGLVLAKGIVFSLISVQFLLPVTVLYLHRFIDKTSHRSLLPSFKYLGKFSRKMRFVTLGLVFLIAVPIFLAQNSNKFLYGMGNYPQGSTEQRERDLIRSKFGNEIPAVVIVPKGNAAAEAKLAAELEQMPEVRSLVSFPTTVGAGLPEAILPENKVNRLESKKYRLMFLALDSADEGDSAFALATSIRQKVSTYYPQDSYVAGTSFSTLDMRNTVSKDNTIVSGIAILAVALVLLITFRSISLPFILIFTIEIAIWINLSLPYFVGNSLNFIGFLVISTVQLGATIDYAILFTGRYLEKRRFHISHHCLAQTVAETTGAILPPALVLSIVGFTLYFVSSISVVSELGFVLGRGTLISAAMVLFLLPALLYIFDPIVRRTTWLSGGKSAWYHNPKHNVPKKDLLK